MDEHGQHILEILNTSMIWTHLTSSGVNSVADEDQVDDDFPAKEEWITWSEWRLEARIPEQGPTNLDSPAK